MVGGRKTVGDFFDYDENNDLCACWYGAFYLGCGALNLDVLIANALVFDSEVALDYACYEMFPDYSLHDALLDVRPDIMNDNNCDWDEITREVEEAYYGSD